LIVGDHGLDPRRLVIDVVVPVLEQACLPVAAVAFRELGDQRDLVRGGRQRQPDSVDGPDDVAVGPGPRVDVGELGHEASIVLVSHSWQDPTDLISLAAQRISGLP